VWGIGVALLGIVGAVMNHVSPQTLLFTSADEQFTGLSWSQVQGLGPRMGSWLVLFYDTTAAMMIFYGLLTSVIGATAYRRGERWAWLSLLLSFVISSAYLVTAAVPFLSQGILGISGISIGLPGIATIMGFLIVGLILPAQSLRKKASAAAAPVLRGPWTLAVGWITTLVLLGAVNVFAAVIVPLTDHRFTGTGVPTYTPPDATFAGVTWAQLVGSHPALATWIVLQMDNMCGRMMGGGILACAATFRGFRRSVRWAYLGLAGALAVYLVPFYALVIPFLQAGVLEPGAISVGSPSTGFVFYAPSAFGLFAFILPYPYLRARWRSDSQAS